MTTDNASLTSDRDHAWPANVALPGAINPTRERLLFWSGWTLSGLTVLFMLFDGIAKLMLLPQVVEATSGIGYPEDVIRPLGIILLICTVLYTIPCTAALGAILLTGFLGGAVASKVRLEDPLFSSVLFGVYFGIPCSHDNPVFLWIDDSEVVRDLIAVSAPVPWHVVAQKVQHCDAKVLEGTVAFVVGGVSVHQPP